MFNPTRIKSELISLVGWRSDPNPSVPASRRPMGDLLSSTSGLWFNDQHPLINNEVLRNISAPFEDYTYSAWSSLATYGLGEIVTAAGSYYASVQALNTNNAIGDTAWWRETNPFSEWLRQRTEAGILRAVNDWLAMKGKFRTASNLLKHGAILKPPGYGTQPASPNKAFCGWVVVPSPQLDIIVAIERIAVNVLTPQQVTIDVYKNGEDVPFDTITIPAGTGPGPLWVACDIELEPGNMYYFAIEAATAPTLVNDIYGMDKDAWQFARFGGTLPFAEAAAFEHAGPGESGWDDVTDIQHNLNNYGINMVLSARCDYTDLIIDHKDLFANAIARAVAITILREIAYNANARINRFEANVDFKHIIYEIDGDPIGREGGFRKEYNAALNLITLDSKKLSQFCLPCKRSGLRLTSI